MSPGSVRVISLISPHCAWVRYSGEGGTQRSHCIYQHCYTLLSEAIVNHTGDKVSISCDWPLVGDYKSLTMQVTGLGMYV